MRSLEFEEVEGFEPRVAVDDEGVPLWVRVEECMRLVDLAIKESKRRGATMVEKEAAYYTAKAAASFTLKEDGEAVTFIQTVIKGVPEVAEAMSAYHAAEVEYRNAQEAVNVYKLKLRVLESEYAREWEQAKRL